ncbi:hypothetical protein CVU82_04020 [Candidatus Falkowbacteria bacterium HGW-Falkowbacteria-1]|uniref:Uncharacterized protein n=1 Tax=Candidatus Falkowbacteria bacterium HGW-Falkowbacteria-1 TaxID=2013768 RepID=A0A2N2E920_9BACT|nr:MAG: hypothetical protein CVU82_04020 [Candidatus Falkowbacteria bacterium HGW-Falkowbacteria-1]
MGFELGDVLGPKLKGKDKEKSNWQESSAQRDLKKMMEDPNYDPINEKSYSHHKLFGYFKESPEKKYSNANLDTFTNEDSFSEFVLEKEVEDQEKNSFEDENIQEHWSKKVQEMKKTEMKEEKEYYKNLPEYSDFEKKEMINALENWLNKRCSHFADGQKMTLEQTLEMVNEFKDNFPEEFSKMIHRKIVTKELGQFNWEEESYNGKRSIVSYYPSKEKPFIKYINNDVDFKNLDKVFVSGAIGGNGKTIKNKNGCILVFCSAPLYYKEKASNKKTGPILKSQKQTI